MGEVEGVGAASGGDPSGEGEVAVAEGFGGEGLRGDELVGPSTEVVGEGVEAQPSGVGSVGPGREVIESQSVFEVSDGGFDNGSAVVAIPEQGGISGLVGDEGVVVNEVK